MHFVAPARQANAAPIYQHRAGAALEKGSTRLQRSRRGVQVEPEGRLLPLRGRDDARLKQASVAAVGEAKLDRLAIRR